MNVPGDLQITIDAYRIDIDDPHRSVREPHARQRACVPAVARVHRGRRRPRFFINGVDTETKGVDLVVNYPLRTAAGRFDLTFTANYNSTDVTAVACPRPRRSRPNPAYVLFGRVNVLTFEKGTPDNKFSLGANWQLNRWGATLRATRYGESLSPDADPALDFEMSAATLVDVEARLGFTESLRLAIGADNVFDEYPDPGTPNAQHDRQHSVFEPRTVRTRRTVRVCGGCRIPSEPRVGGYRGVRHRESRRRAHRARKLQNSDCSMSLTLPWLTAGSDLAFVI